MQLSLLVFFTFCLIPQSHLAFANTSSSSSLRYKFQKWFPKYRTQLAASAARCRTKIELYQRWEPTEDCERPCSCVVDCILEQTAENIKVNMAAAVVVLGLTPSILAMLGPSIAEAAVLTTERPLLSLFLALGAPAINMPRVFERPRVDDALAVRPTAVTQAIYASIRRRGAARGGIILSASEYLLAAGALSSTIATSVQLDLRTVSGWRCNQIMMPLMWSMSGGVVHLCAATALRLSADAAAGSGPAPTARSISSSSSSSSSSRSRPAAVLSWMHRQLLRECTPCVFRRPRLHKSVDSPMADVMYWLASFFGLIHMVFGIMVFSSLVFISLTDALVVLVRYAVAASVCRVIFMFELAGIQIRNGSP
jgi:hypothetical protein